MPQSQTTDWPMSPRGKVTELKQSLDSKNIIDVKQPARLFNSSYDTNMYAKIIIMAKKFATVYVIKYFQESILQVKV